MISHHPDESLLMDYSAGSLSEPKAICVRLHLQKCSRCRGQIDMMNSLGAIVMEHEADDYKAAAQKVVEMSMREGLFASIMDRIEAEDDTPPKATSAQEDILEKIVSQAYDELPWKKQLGDVSMYDLTEKVGTEQERVTMQKLLPGGRAPKHSHQGEEITVVLQGAFSDENGVFEAGDFVVLDRTHNHQPVALHGDDCITFSVLTAPVRLTGTFTRLLNPFIS